LGLVNLKMKTLEALATCHEFGFADSHAHRSASSLHHLTMSRNSAQRFVSECRGGEHARSLVEAFDQKGKLIGTVPNEKRSSAFRSALQNTFEHSVSPDPDGVIAIISNPMTVKSV